MSTNPLARRIAAAGALALAAGLLGGIAHAAPDPTEAGQVVYWGQTGATPPPLPGAIGSTPIAEVAAFGTQAIFLTASGEVIMLRSPEDQPSELVPDELEGEKVISIAATNTYAALTESGRLVFWGTSDGPSTDTGSTPLNDLTQIALGSYHGVGLKADGTVVAWGSDEFGQATVPDGLTDVTKVVAGDEHTFALRGDGTVVGWGRNQQAQVTLPTEITEPGDNKVIDVAARSRGGLALLQDGSLISWGDRATASGFGAKYNLPPASLDGRTISSIAAGSNAANLAIDDTGTITTWGSGVPDAVPADLDGRTVSQVTVSSELAIAVQPEVMTITPSVTSGTAREGQTLTGTAATFSGEPESVSTQWLADGTPIVGATDTSFTLGTAQIGKKISFRTTATKGEEVVNSESEPTAAVAALPPAVTKSNTKVAKVKVKKTKKSKKNGKATIKIKVTGANPTGKVKLVVKASKKKVFNKAVRLNKKGVAKAKLKKLKKGKYKINATYKGDQTNTKSKAKAKFRVK